jgi:hypothetical protein
MSEHPTEAQRRRIHQAAHLLDTRFRIPGTRVTFGLDPILGLVPGGGDIAGLLAGSALVVQAVRLGARGWTLALMLWHLTVDAVVGSVPVLGTIFDVVYKANQRNVRLLEHHVDDPPRTRSEARRAVVRSLVAIAAVVVAVSTLLVAATVWLLQWLLS